MCAAESICISCECAAIVEKCTWGICSASVKAYAAHVSVLLLPNSVPQVGVLLRAYAAHVSVVLVPNSVPEVCVLQ